MVITVVNNPPNKRLLSPLRGSDSQIAARFACPKSRRVCQAWHLAREVRVLSPGVRNAEG